MADETNEKPEEITKKLKTWEVVAEFDSFSEADKKRKALELQNKEVKVRKRPKGTFSVKQRVK